MMRSKEIRERLKDIDEFLLAEYKLEKGEEKRDWRTYEEQYLQRIKEAVRQLKPSVDEAAAGVEEYCGPGRPHGLTLKQRVLLLLLQRLFGESNRMMAAMLSVFSMLTDVDVSYKTIERLYSDDEVDLALQNLHIIILKKKGVENPDVSGDGTGYSLSIKQHYASEAEKLKDDAKEKKDDAKMAFVYSFKLIDVKSKMYLVSGTSLKSEKEAFVRAKDRLEEYQITLNSVRLDRYYSYPCYLDAFDDTPVYVIPKKNATLNGSWKWKRTMIDFVNNTKEYLEQYYKRENSECGWSMDKRRFGWGIAQRLPRRIDAADFCTAIWHNLLQLGAG